MMYFNIDKEKKTVSFDHKATYPCRSDFRFSAGDMPAINMGGGARRESYKIRKSPRGEIEMVLRIFKYKGFNGGIGLRKFTVEVATDIFTIKVYEVWAHDKVSAVDKAKKLNEARGLSFFKVLKITETTVCPKWTLTYAGMILMISQS